MKYTISEKANEDINTIWEYTLENWSIEQADRYYNLIIDEIEYLSKNAKSGKSIDYVRKGYRVSTVKSHLIFYKLREDNYIEVIRILHQRMDIDNRLDE